MTRKTRTSRLNSTLGTGFVLLGGAALGSGCLERPVEPISPNTSSIFVKSVRATAIDKIDLLFMIDNSISMGDKQAILTKAVPNLLQRLVDPDCLNEEKQVVTKNTDGTCPAGSQAAFKPIKDIHIAAITSALGAHGGDYCSGPSEGMERFNDYARLLPTVREQGTVPNPDGTGFLSWKGGGAVEQQTLLDDFAQHVAAAGENGCGFEASLESWYRFLVDPNPPKDSLINKVGRESARTPERDELLLEQRRAFLRSDSLVAIIMLTDENDCSIADRGRGWTVTSPKEQYLVSSEACDTDPNDPCCYSCSYFPPEGCEPSSRCQGASTATLSAEQDRGNTRCVEQKRRFGVDLLWPVQRYIDGLTKTQVVDEWDPARPLVPNELFIARGDAPPREPSRVVFAGIVGVPWQDIATPESLTGDKLEYLSAKDIPWDVVLGDPAKGVPPSDPLMVESFLPRPGLAAPGSWGNPINGNEVNNGVPHEVDGLPANDDLQYACVFRLDERIDCSKPENERKCDCADELDLSKGKPLCQDGAGASQERWQYYAKAYPGTRMLEVLKGIGDNAIAASICPKNPVDDADPKNPDRGYNPAVKAILDIFTKVMRGQCLPAELDVNEGKVPCLVIEAKQGLGDPGCDRVGREDVKPEVARVVRAELEAQGSCGEKAGTDCASIELCGIRQLTEESEKESCFHDDIPKAEGFCYIDPAKGSEGGGICDAEGKCTNKFVDDCPAEQRRILRFVGTDENPMPAPNATILTACVDS